jgi:hypothetical protein
MNTVISVNKHIFGDNPETLKSIEANTLDRIYLALPFLASGRHSSIFLRSLANFVQQSGLWRKPAIFLFSLRKGNAERATKALARRSGGLAASSESYSANGETYSGSSENRTACSEDRNTV